VAYNIINEYLNIEPTKFKVFANAILGASVGCAFNAATSPDFVQPINHNINDNQISLVSINEKAAFGLIKTDESFHIYLINPNNYENMLLIQDPTIAADFARLVSHRYDLSAPIIDINNYTLPQKISADNITVNMSEILGEVKVNIINPELEYPDNYYDYTVTQNNLWNDAKISILEDNKYTIPNKNDMPNAEIMHEFNQLKSPAALIIGAIGMNLFIYAGAIKRKSLKTEPT